MTSAPLPRSTPESHGIASAAIARFVQAIEENGLELHSLMLVKDGDVVAEGWWHPYKRDYKHSLFSLSKSFTSSAIGMAVAEGLLSLDDRVVSFFPDDAPADPSADLTAMQVRHLLMMGTGHTADTMDALHHAQDGNWVRAFLACPVDKAPGTHFLYNTGATYMLSAILHKVSGLDLLDYLQPRLLEPLGIEGAVWERCPRGLSVGGFGLSIATEDIARFGLLYLNKGIWEGRQLIAADWIAEATSKRISNDDGSDSDWTQGYGYQFWRCRHGAYRGDGAFGQYCVVMSEQNAVLAMTGGTNHLQGVLDQVWAYLLPAMQPTAARLAAGTADSEESTENEETLRQRLRGLQLTYPTGERTSDLEKEISGQSYRLEPNERNWTTLALRFTDSEAILTLSGGEQGGTVHCGRNDWAMGESDLLTPAPTKLASRMIWESPGRLLLTLRFVETPFCLSIAIDYEDDSLTLAYRMNVGFGEQEPAKLTGRMG